MTNQILEGKLSDIEIRMVKNIFDHAIEGMGLGKYTHDEQGKRVGFRETNPYPGIVNKFFSYENKENFSMPREVWSAFIKAYVDACNALDPWEIQTVTGYSWVEAQEITQKLVNWNRRTVNK